MASGVNVQKLNVERANKELSCSRRGAIYRAVEQLGQGRRGNIFLCDNLDHEENAQPARVALRFLPRQASNASNDGLSSEISTHWLLNHHPHVLNFYTILLTRSFIVIVMEYAPGGTLASYITSLITHTSIQSSRHRRSSGQPSTLSSTLTGTNTDLSMASDHSYSGRHSQHPDPAGPERKRLSIVRRLFQQLITLLEYVQLCGIALGEFQPECFMVSFDDPGDGGPPIPSLRLSHFGHHHSEHPTLEERTPTPPAQSDPDGPFCAVDLLHWTQTHAKPNLAPPPTIDPTREAPCACHDIAPASPGAISESSRCSHHSSQSYRSRCSAKSQEREREKCASRLLDVASAGMVLFYMIHGREPFPSDGDEMIKSWRSKDSSGIAWPSSDAARTAAGQLISWMLQPAGARCTLEEVKHDPFFLERLPEYMHMITNNACNEEFSAEQRTSFMTDIRDIVYVSRKPSAR